MKYAKILEVLLTASWDLDLGLTRELIKRKLSQRDNELLISKPSGEEIKCAIFEIGALKFSGPYGYNAKFYQIMWKVVGPDIVEIIKNK